MHINLCDLTAQQQQEAIGILGVSLIYAAFHQRSARETFLGGLFDALSSARIEIDVMDFDGPAFGDQDARGWCLELRLLAEGMSAEREPASLLEMTNSACEPRREADGV